MTLITLTATQSTAASKKCGALQYRIYDPKNPERTLNCEDCPNCAPGMGVPVQCGSSVPNGTIIKCKDCQLNKTFSNTNDLSMCKLCNECQKIVLQQCTLTQDRKCGRCLPKHFFNPLLDDCMECYFCCPSIPENEQMEQCKSLGLPRNEWCEATKGNKLCKQNWIATPSAVLLMVIVGALIYKKLFRRHSGPLQRNQEYATVEQANPAQQNVDLDIKRIPEDCVISDMEKLCMETEKGSIGVMKFQVQKKLDSRETPQRRTWGSVGLALRVDPEDLDLILNSTRQTDSPTDSILEYFKTLGDREPKMRKFVQALIGCGREDLAGIICNWSYDDFQNTPRQAH